MNLCREKTRRTKTQFDLNLAIAIKDNKNCFYKYIKKTKGGLENISILYWMWGNIVIKDEEKAEILNALGCINA